MRYTLYNKWKRNRGFWDETEAWKSQMRRLLLGKRRPAIRRQSFGPVLQAPKSSGHGDLANPSIQRTCTSICTVYIPYGCVRLSLLKISSRTYCFSSSPRKSPRALVTWRWTAD